MARVIHTSPRARKNYTCDECGGSIYAGDTYEYYEYWDKWDSRTGKHVEHYHHGCD